LGTYLLKKNYFLVYFKLIKVRAHDQDEKKEKKEKKEREFINKEVMSSVTTVLKPTPDSVKKRSIDEAFEMKTVSNILVFNFNRCSLQFISLQI
jgi:hypothetical protein